MYKEAKQSSILLFSLITVSLFCSAQSSKGFTISGHLDGLVNGDLVKLGNRFIDWHIPNWTDSCVIVNGSFHLQGDEVREGPKDYEIYFFKGENGHSLGKAIDDDLPFHTGHSLHVFVENGDKIFISGNSQKWRDIKISGSRATDAYIWANSLVYYADRSNSKIRHRLRKITDSIGYDMGLVEEQINLKRKIDSYLDSAIRSAPAAYQIVIPYLIVTLHDFFAGYHGYFQKDIFSKLSSEVQNTLLGRQARNFALLSVGQPFPGFSLSSPEKAKIDLNDFARKNKITLVHFWGTNSADREHYQTELKAMYSKFHAKGLGIIAVSADTSKEDWNIVVHLKKYPWTNVIAEPKGWGDGSLTNDRYGEGGHVIPNTTNVLLDAKGTILAWDVYGPELNYYLEKYLGTYAAAK